MATPANKGGASASSAKAEQTIKATAAQKQAAERLGSMFNYLADLKAVPLDVWTIPLERTGSGRGEFQSALREIYGSDTSDGCSDGRIT